MCRGAPDYTKLVKLMGWDGTKLVPIFVAPDGQLFALMKGYTGTEYKTLKVADDGSIIAVMKGDYAGTLKTVGLDEKGRLTVFLCDAEDLWGNVVAVGNAELAARMGSPKSFDKRGEVLLIDGFEEGISKWSLVPAGTGAEIVLSTGTARSGAYSAKIKTSATIDQESRLYRGIAYPKTSNFGVEFSFLTPHVNYAIVLSVSGETGAESFYGAIRFREDTADCHYYDLDGTWHQLADLSRPPGSQYICNTAKLVINFPAGEYLRFLWGDEERDLSGKNFYREVMVAAPYVMISVGIAARVTLSKTVYVDDFIITQNEPV